MSTYGPAYRLRCYAPRSVDVTEQTVLTPAAGAPHSNPFQVATLPTASSGGGYFADSGHGYLLLLPGQGTKSLTTTAYGYDLIL